MATSDDTEFREVAEAFAQELSHIKNAGRQPTSLEYQALYAALTAMSVGSYALAAEAIAACRGEVAPDRIEIPAPHGLTLEGLRDAFQEVVQRRIDLD